MKSKKLNPQQRRFVDKLLLGKPWTIRENTLKIVPKIPGMICVVRLRGTGDSIWPWMFLYVYKYENNWVYLEQHKIFSARISLLTSEQLCQKMTQPFTAQQNVLTGYGTSLKLVNVSNLVEMAARHSEIPVEILPEGLIEQVVSIRVADELEEHNY